MAQTIAQQIEDLEARLRKLRGEGTYRIHYQRPGEPGPTPEQEADPNLIWVEFVEGMPADAPIVVTKYGPDQARPPGEIVHELF